MAVEPDDYLNLSSAQPQDEFALDKPFSDSSYETTSKSSRFFLIMSLTIGFFLVLATIMALFGLRIWDISGDTPIYQAEEVKTVEPVVEIEKRNIVAAPVTSKVDTTKPNPLTNNSSTPPPLSVALRELTPAIGMVVVRTPSAISSGSGFVIREDGLFITNNHVIEGAQEIRIKLNDRTEVNTAVIEKVDTNRDLALLRLREPGPYPTVKLEENLAPELGEEVMILGYPLGTKLGLDISVSTGIVSSLRNYSGVNLIQTNAAINHGNSGGPMIYRRTGQVIGVVTAKLRDSDAIGFAINVKELTQFLTER